MRRQSATEQTHQQKLFAQLYPLLKPDIWWAWQELNLLGLSAALGWSRTYNPQNEAPPKKIGQALGYLCSTQ
jgi:hypothetical protein